MLTVEQSGSARPCRPPRYLCDQHTHLITKMAKEKLLVASTTPVDLDDSDKKKSTESESSKAESKEDESKELAEEETTKDDKEERDEDKTEDKETETTAVKPKGPESKELKQEEEGGAPPPPERPLSPLSRVKKDLQDAFPNVEEKYVQAVLIASQGQADPAFNALLYILDPTFVPDITPPAPPVPPKQELTDDELLARKLQKEFEREDRKRRAQHRRKNQQPVQGDESPDEIDHLKESFTQGFEEAKTTINGWVLGLSKKFSQEPDSQNRAQGPKLFGALGGLSFNQNQRAKRFDEDPEILSLDFNQKVNLEQDKPPLLPKREKSPGQKEEPKWQPLNSDVPVTLDAFLVTDSEDEEPATATTNKK